MHAVVVVRVVSAKYVSLAAARIYLANPCPTMWCFKCVILVYVHLVSLLAWIQLIEVRLCYQTTEEWIESRIGIKTRHSSRYCYTLDTIPIQHNRLTMNLFEMSYIS